MSTPSEVVPPTNEIIQCVLRGNLAIIALVDDPDKLDKLANDLCSSELLPEYVRKKVIEVEASATDMKNRMLIRHLERSFLIVDRFDKFCEILCKQKSPSLTALVEEMKKFIKLVQVAMDTSDKSDSTLIKQHYTEIVHTLKDSFCIEVLMHSLFFDSNLLRSFYRWIYLHYLYRYPSMVAHTLVEYIIDNIDNQEHCDKIWRALDNVIPPLSDIVTKMKFKRVSQASTDVVKAESTHTDEGKTDTDSGPLDNLRKCIGDTLEFMYIKHSRHEDYLAMWLFQKVLEFLSALSLKNSVEEIKTHCSKFLKYLQAIGGQAELVANKLGRNWNEDVYKKLDISFFLSYSDSGNPPFGIPNVVREISHTDIDTDEITDSNDPVGGATTDTTQSVEKEETLKEQHPTINYNQRSFTYSQEKCLPHTLYWYDYHFKITIQEGAMKLGEAVTFTVEALKSYDNLQLPDSHYLVSDIFQVSCSRTRFENDVTLTCYHAVPIEREEECSDFAFFSAKDTNSEFKLLRGGTFSDHYASIGGKHFCLFGIFKQSIEKISLRFMVSYKPKVKIAIDDQKELDLLFYVTRNCYADLKFEGEKLEDFQFHTLQVKPSQLYPRILLQILLLFFLLS